MTKELVDLTKRMNFELPLTCCFFRPMKVRIIGGTFVDNKKYGTTRFHVGIQIKQIAIIRI
jgi:hypothetical protein